MNIEFKRLHENAVIPTYGDGNESNAGLDFYLIEDVLVNPGEYIRLPTGLAWQPSHEEWHTRVSPYWKFALLIRTRSSTFARGLFVIEGTVDEQYRDEIKIQVYNPSDCETVCLKSGDRIAQAVPILIPICNIIETETLNKTDRNGGFGSTGS